MSPDPRPMMVWLAAYLAAGVLYVLRGLGDAWPSVVRGEFSWFSLVAVCRLSITLGSFVSLHRTRSLPVVLARLGLEAVPPTALFLATAVVANVSQ